MGLSDAHLALVFVDEYDTAGKYFRRPRFPCNLPSLRCSTLARRVGGDKGTCLSLYQAGRPRLFGSFPIARSYRARFTRLGRLLVGALQQLAQLIPACSAASRFVAWLWLTRIQALAP